MDSADADRRPGADRSLHSLYELVPDAYELDLLEEARRPPVALLHDWAAAFARVHRETIAAMGYDEVEAPAGPDGPAPSPTQACFLVERLLGGEVVDDETC
ncbi:hypothetical protein H9L21_02175 [Aeromicrobium senzhongii]|uniref:Uncharacterized protein n=1 Tax=Aeromicrobium senzhongii TaxID=2663859 RepID=A0ABX6SUN9_9ACTN|nr:hypothetical protein [Aeromicrobium senzhongii]MTB88221.1 hypothetical protein [Aeromicrobium senzhongii]QNL94791.1 hypothetical protein H9L21_02175 [Aeromicrobium senzhongii]